MSIRIDEASQLLMRSMAQEWIGKPDCAPLMVLLAKLLRQTNPDVSGIAVTHVPNNDLEADFGDIKALVTVDGEWETGMIFKRPAVLEVTTAAEPFDQAAS